MPDIINPDGSDNENFEKLLKESLESRDNFTTGDQVTGTVVFITGDTVFINVSGKSEALIDASEFMDDRGDLTIKKGDTLTAYVVSTGGGEIRLTTSIGHGVVSPELLNTAYRHEIPVNGTVIASIKGGFTVSVSGVQCFCPASQIDRRYSGEPSDYLNKSFSFKVTQFSERGRNIVLSRRDFLDRQRDERRIELDGTVREGDTISGTIVSVQNYGVVVDLDGLEAFIPRTELTWGRGQDLSRFKPGDRIDGIILELNSKGRMVLSHRQLTPEPWTRAGNYSPEQGVNGRVVNIIKSGAFIEIEEGIEGFLPVSRMSLIKKIARPEDCVALNDIVNVKIIEIKPAEKRMLLELVTNEADPWQVRDDSFIDEVFMGVIESAKPNGLTLRLPNGMQGYVPKRELLRDKGDIPSTYPVGGEIKISVKEINRGERKLILSERGASQKIESKEFSSYMRDQNTETGESSTLGNLFKDKFSEIKGKIKSDRKD